MRLPHALILSSLLAVSASAACPTSGGDPVTTFDGVSTRYWLKNGTETELFRLGNVALWGTAGPTPGYKKSVGEWLHSTRLVKGGETVLLVTVNHAANLSESRNDKTALRALSVRTVGGAALIGTGKAESGGVSVSVHVDLTRRTPDEIVRVAIGDDLGLVIRSSVANKFADEAERFRHIHLDLEWTHIARKEEAVGVLPEIWGLAPMSAATKAMLVPPRGRRLQEDDCPQLGEVVGMRGVLLGDTDPYMLAANAYSCPSGYYPVTTADGPFPSCKDWGDTSGFTSSGFDIWLSGDPPGCFATPNTEQYYFNADMWTPIAGGHSEGRVLVCANKAPKYELGDSYNSCPLYYQPVMDADECETWGNTQTFYEQSTDGNGYPNTLPGDVHGCFVYPQYTRYYFNNDKTTPIKPGHEQGRYAVCTGPSYPPPPPAQPNHCGGMSPNCNLPPYTCGFDTGAGESYIFDSTDVTLYSDWEASCSKSWWGKISASFDWNTFTSSTSACVGGTCMSDQVNNLVCTQKCEPSDGCSFDLNRYGSWLVYQSQQQVDSILKSVVVGGQVDVFMYGPTRQNTAVSFYCPSGAHPGCNNDQADPPLAQPGVGPSDSPACRGPSDSPTGVGFFLYCPDGYFTASMLPMTGPALQNTSDFLCKDGTHPACYNDAGTPVGTSADAGCAANYSLACEYGEYYDSRQPMIAQLQAVQGGLMNFYNYLPAPPTGSAGSSSKALVLAQAKGVATIGNMTTNVVPPGFVPAFSLAFYQTKLMQYTKAFEDAANKLTDAEESQMAIQMFAQSLNTNAAQLAGEQSVTQVTQAMTEQSMKTAVMEMQAAMTGLQEVQDKLIDDIQPAFEEALKDYQTSSLVSMAINLVVDIALCAVGVGGVMLAADASAMEKTLGTISEIGSTLQEVGSMVSETLEIEGALPPDMKQLELDLSQQMTDFGVDMSSSAPPSEDTMETLWSISNSLSELLPQFTSGFWATYLAEVEESYNPFLTGYNEDVNGAAKSVIDYTEAQCAYGNDMFNAASNFVSTIQQYLINGAQAEANQQTQAAMNETYAVATNASNYNMGQVGILGVQVNTLSTQIQVTMEQVLHRIRVSDHPPLPSVHPG